MTKQQKRLWLAVLLSATAGFPMGSALLVAEQYEQQETETVAAPDPVDDDRTLLDVFGEVAKEYLTQQMVRLSYFQRVLKCSDSALFFIIILTHTVYIISLCE
jgi:hypothetical protein